MVGRFSQEPIAPPSRIALFGRPEFHLDLPAEDTEEFVKLYKNLLQDGLVGAAGAVQLTLA